MAAFIAIWGVPKGWETTLSGMFICMGAAIGTGVAMGAATATGAGASTGESVVGEERVGEGAAATAHGGGSGSAAWSSSGRSSAMMQPLPVWVPLWWWVEVPCDWVVVPQPIDLGAALSASWHVWRSLMFSAPSSKMRVRLSDRRSRASSSSAIFPSLFSTSWLHTFSFQLSVSCSAARLVSALASSCSIA